MSSVVCRFLLYSSDPPPQPRDAKLTITSHNTASVTVLIEWNATNSASLEFSINITAEEFKDISSSFTQELNYSINYTISITASNCAGSSTATLVDYDQSKCMYYII